MATPQALTPEQIQQIIAAGRGNTVNIGGTLYGGNWADQGSGESMQEGPLQSIYGSTGINQAGQPYYEYSPTGSFVQQGVTKKDQSFFGGLVDAFKDPVVLAALGGAGYAGLLGGGGAAGLTASELAAADMALGGVGGTAGAEALAGAATAGAGASALSSLTPTQLANLAKAGINVAGLLGATNAISNIGGNNTSTATPITYSGSGAGGYSPDYFSQVQSNYNSLMPGVPRDVASPLQQWYSTEFNPGASVTGSLFGDMTGSKTGGMAPSTFKPVTTTVTKPTTTTTTTVAPSNVTTVTGGGGNDTVVNPGSAGYQYAINNLGWTPDQYTGSINQWILDNPRATKEQQDAALATAGISQADLENALNVSNFSDATKYALTHGGSLQNLGNIIVDWVNANPTATNEQIQAEQAKWGISDQDVANAMYGLNSSAGKEWAVVQDMGLNQYYKNIADAAKSGISVADAVAQMQQYGVSPADVKQAYSMFAPAGGLTLDEVLAAYNK
jgi:uncharacterized protein YpmB